MRGLIVDTQYSASKCLLHLCCVKSLAGLYCADSEAGCKGRYRFTDLTSAKGHHRSSLMQCNQGFRDYGGCGRTCTHHARIQVFAFCTELDPLNKSHTQRFPLQLVRTRQPVTAQPLGLTSSMNTLHWMANGIATIDDVTGFDKRGMVL
jgi:hypothetical protein